MAKLSEAQKKRLKKNMAMIQPPALGVRRVASKLAKKGVTKAAKAVAKTRTAKRVANKTVALGKSVRTKLPNQKKKLKITNQPNYNKSTTAKPGRQRYARRRK